MSRAGLVAFALVCAAQLAVVSSTWLAGARTLATGEVFRFRVVPVDPIDPFRGRYVRLQFAEQHVTVYDTELRSGDPAWALIERDPETGVARPVALRRAAPRAGPALLVRVAGVDDAGGRAAIDWPFDRFWANEARAPELERRLADPQARAWARVRVRGEHALLADLEVEP